MKIWAKIMRDDKLIKDIVYEDAKILNSSNYISALQDICYKLDVTVPVSLPTHYKHFENFNRIKYLPRDFIEEVDFTAFILERIIENKKKPQEMVY